LGEDWLPALVAADDADDASDADVIDDPGSFGKLCSGSSIPFVRSVDELKNFGFELNIHLLTRNS
jgi:hypothetical protein